jgi:hypothetical protein
VIEDIPEAGIVRYANDAPFVHAFDTGNTRRRCLLCGIRGCQRTDPHLALHSGQREVFENRARFRVLVTSRRWGKTTLQKAEILRDFGQPGLVWYLAPTYDMCRDLMWAALRAIVPRAWLLSEPNESRMEMDTIWGCRFACKSVEHPDRLRGRGPRKVLGDEFQDWKDGQRTWEEVILPSLLTSDGSALLTGTPKSFNHFHDAYQRGQTGVKDWASWQFTAASAPHIPKGFLKQMEAEMDPRSYRQEFEASFEAMAGRAYYAFNRTQHVGQVPFHPDLPACVSFDFNIHPATAIIGQAHGDEPWVWREVWIPHAGGEATKAAAMKAWQFLREAGHRGEVRIYGDPAGKSEKTTGPSDHAVLKEVFPSASWQINRAAPHVKDRVASVNARCVTSDGQIHLRVDPSCKHLIADLEQVIFTDDGQLDKDTNPDLTHISDALGYWINKDFPVVKPKEVVGVARLPDWM